MLKTPQGELVSYYLMRRKIIKQNENGGNL